MSLDNSMLSDQDKSDLADFLLKKNSGIPRAALLNWIERIYQIIDMMEIKHNAVKLGALKVLGDAIGIIKSTENLGPMDVKRIKFTVKGLKKPTPPEKPPSPFA